MYKVRTLYDYNTPAAPIPQRSGLTAGNTPIEIALGIDEQGRTTARKLYAFLELDATHYSRWCKRNITENDFAEENVDFFYSPSMASEQGARNFHSSSSTSKRSRGNFAQDYLLTATFAKKLAMASNSARGEQAREYFIRVEEQLKRLVTSGQQANMIPQEPPRVTLDEIEILDKLQASTRYNLGRDSLLSVGRECDGLVFIGRRILYNRRRFDQYFENYCGRRARG